MDKLVIDFEKETKRLDEIVSMMSSKKLSLDESLKMYEEGQEIIKRLEEALAEAQQKVENVVSIK